MENKLYKLEALRGLAALYVVFHHTVSNKFTIADVNVGVILRFGQEAVILFFLLSGFVISYSYQRTSKKDFAAYFARRSVRIYVPLLFAFLASYLSLSYNAGAWVNPQFGQLLANLAMLQDWPEARPTVIAAQYMDNGPLWSLSYEWWFYMLFFPLIRYVKEENQRDNIVFGVAILAAITQLFYTHFAIRVLMYLAIWWSGVYLSNRYIQGELDSWKSLAKPVAAMSVIVLILSIGVFEARQQGLPIALGRHPLIEVRYFVFALFAVALAWVWRSLHWRLFDILLKPFALLAPISYAIYILHDPLFRDATYFSFVSNDVVRWCLYFGVTIAASYLVERVIYPTVKRPLISYLENLRILGKRNV